MTLFTPETLPPVLDCEMIAADIAEGLRQSCSECPIARMLHRLFPLDTNYWWYVWKGSAETISDFGNEANYKLDANAVSFVARFDEGLPVQPGTFRFRRAGA